MNEALVGAGLVITFVTCIMDIVAIRLFFGPLIQGTNHGGHHGKTRGKGKNRISATVPGGSGNDPDWGWHHLLLYGFLLFVAFGLHMVAFKTITFLLSQ